METSVAQATAPAQRVAAAVAAALVAARGQLFPWVPVMLALGIGGYFAPAGEPSALALSIAVTTIAMAGIGRLFGPEALHPVAFGAGLLAAGFLLAVLRSHAVTAPVLPFRYYGPIEGRIVKIDRSASDALRLTLDRVVLGDVPPSRTPARIRVALHGPAADTTPEPGSHIMLTGHLAPPEGPVSPGGFDFQRQAWFARLGAVGYTRSPVLRVAPAQADLPLAAFRWRMHLSGAIQSRIDGQAGALAAAFLTGDRSAISAETNDVMRASNLSHLISISGLHMALVVSFIFGLVRYGIALVPPVALRVNSRVIAAIVALVAATGYLVLAGPDVATERSWIMASVILVAILARRRAVSLRSVAVAAIVLLCVGPEALTQPGFQMSFGATVALILAFRQWQEVQGRVHWLLRPIAVMVLSSVVAGAATGPIAAAHFNRIAGYGLVANLLAVPIMGLAVMPAGVLAALLAPVGLAEPALWVLERGTSLVLKVAQAVAGWEGAVRGIVTPPEWVLPTLAIGFLASVLFTGRWRLPGVALVVASMGGWWGADRPDILISSDGRAVAIMTPSGRTPSRPTGSGFVLSTWLEDDGDLTTPENAFARGAFDGARGQSSARWNSLEIVHLTGKTAPERAIAACRQGRMLILDADLDQAGPCDIWDRSRLQATGSVAIYPTGDGSYRIVTARQVSGNRLWSQTVSAPSGASDQ